MDTYEPHGSAPDALNTHSEGERAFHPPGSVLRLLGLGAHLTAHPGRLPAGLPPNTLTETLADVRTAEAHIERATLAVLGAARAQGQTWPRIGHLLGMADSGARALYTRLRSRYPDYTPPLAPTLEAYTDRAHALLHALEPKPSPGTAGLVAPRLGAVLLTAALIGADDDTLGTWLVDDTLSTPAHLLLGSHPVPTSTAYNELAEHRADPDSIRRTLVELMRRALPLAPAPAPALETAEPDSVAGENEPLHTLEELRALALSWLRALPEPGEAGEQQVAAHRLGAVLLAATIEETGLDEAIAHVVPHWLDRDDTLQTAARVLAARPCPRTGPAHEILAAHARDDAPTRVRLVALMREALDGPAGPGKESAPEKDASGSLPTATATTSLEPDPGPAPVRRPGYARPLEWAGLPPAAADALAEPLTRFVGEATLVSHREVHLQTRQVMQALQPTLLSQRPARVRTLLYLLPRLDLYGLGGWAPLALAISEHAPELERLPSSADLLGTADLPAHLAQDVDALVNGARRVLVASWAPTAPEWKASPALERLTTAVEGNGVDDLANALAAVAELDQALLGQDSAFGSHQLHYQWENLAHAWRQARPATPAAPGWSLLAAKMFPNAAMAEAVAHLLETSGPLLDTATLGEGQTHQALSTLRQAVFHGRTAGLGTVLDDVLNLKPSGRPVKDHPQVAHALTALINAYDHQ